jgi:hypothetical protein
MALALHGCSGTFNKYNTIHIKEKSNAITGHKRKNLNKFST